MNYSHSLQPVTCKCNQILQEKVGFWRIYIFEIADRKSDSGDMIYEI